VDVYLIGRDEDGQITPVGQNHEVWGTRRAPPIHEAGDLLRKAMASTLQCKDVNVGC